MWKLNRTRCWCAALLAAVMLAAAPYVPPAAAQGLEELLSISVNAGYDTRFRPEQWTPLHIEINNQGDAVQGRLVVRPETSGNALANTFSTPVDIAPNTTQSIFLYIIARSGANIIRVEVLSDAGNVITSRDVALRSIAPRDRLYVVVTQAVRGALDLTSLSVGGYNAFQAIWSVRNIPDKAAALDAVDVLMFADIDTGTLNPAQQNAIESWVAGGGHLIVTGGANWQPTAAGLAHLLPLVPESGIISTDLEALIRLAGDHNTQVEGEFIVARGQLNEDAQVLAANTDGHPLAARRQLGSGTIDYIAIDPNNPMLAGWNNMPELWFTLMSSTDSRPSWSHGFANWQRAATAVEVLPGIDVLPAALGLLGFLLAYVALIGPVNYLLLNRLNRREWAWITIPALIVLFSVLAWSVGFELRGNQATLSRLSVVQTWPDTEDARIDQLIGLLAPRRGNYTLSMTDNRLMRPFTPTLTNATIMGGRLQLNADIRQTERFEAVEFPVDASFIAAFSTTGSTARPDIGGRVVLSYPPYNQRTEREDYYHNVQGVIRNDSDFTLHDPVILARGLAMPLDEPFRPGALVTFNSDDLLLPGDGPPLPSALEYAIGEANPFVASTTISYRPSRLSILEDTSRNAMDILGEDHYRLVGFSVSFRDSRETQEMRRRQAFLDSFMIDHYASTARGNRVYLAGWAESTPSLETMQGADGFDVVDTTLYLIELEVERDPNISGNVLVTADQFTWISRQRESAINVAPVNLSLVSESEVIFRFTPLPDAVLAQVNELTLITQGVRSAQLDEPLELWNWQQERWEAVRMLESGTNRYVIRNPARFIGPQNAVQIRSIREGRSSTVFIERLAVEQRGQF
jgi:hypothetical protein